MKKAFYYASCFWALVAALIIARNPENQDLAQFIAIGVVFLLFLDWIRSELLD